MWEKNMDSIMEVWRAVLAYCKTKVSEVMYNMWLEPLEVVKFENDTVVFSVSSEFQRSIISTKFKEILIAGFEDVMGFPVDIDIIATNLPAAGEKKEKAKSEKADGEKAQEGSSFNGNRSYTFENFVVGKSNALAYNTAFGVAHNPGSITNPFLIYGRSGLGKTHLMFAILNQLQKDHPDFVIIYTTGENFMNEMVESISKKTMAAFRNKYRNVDVLLMDDIQFIQRTESVQEEFFNTFNALYNSNKQIILTSDVPPRNMEVLEDRLRTRFEMGVTADIQPPDLDTRKGIIKRKSEQIGLNLPESTVEYIASKVKNNIRQLEGIVKKIYAMSVAYGSPLTNDQLNMIIRDVTTESQPISVTVEKVIEYIARAFDLPVADIKSEKRASKINTARQSALYVIKEVTTLTLAEIGSYFGNKSHATVIHAIDTARKKMDDVPSVKAVIFSAINEFGNSQQY